MTLASDKRNSFFQVRSYRSQVLLGALGPQCVCVYVLFFFGGGGGEAEGGERKYWQFGTRLVSCTGIIPHERGS